MFRETWAENLSKLSQVNLKTALFQSSVIVRWTRRQNISYFQTDAGHAISFVICKPKITFMQLLWCHSLLTFLSMEQLSVSLWFLPDRIWDVGSGRLELTLTGHNDLWDWFIFPNLNTVIIFTYKLLYCFARKTKLTLTRHKKFMRAMAQHPKEYALYRAVVLISSYYENIFASASANNIK